MPALVPGTSIGVAGCPPGTYGCLVRSTKADGQLYALTAGHVLLSPQSQVQASVFSPDAASGASVVGNLERWVDPTTGAAGADRVDVAIARLLDLTDISPRIPRIGRPTGRTDVIPPRSRVQLYGGTSHWCEGWVADIDYEAPLKLDFPGKPQVPVLLKHLVLCTRFTSRGDSGAAVLNEHRQVVGIHVGSTPSASFFCRIGEVCRLLDVEIVT